MIVRDFRFILNQSVIDVSVNVDHRSILQTLRKDKANQSVCLCEACSQTIMGKNMWSWLLTATKHETIAIN